MKNSYLFGGATLVGLLAVGGIRVATDDRSVENLCAEFKVRHAPAIQKALENQSSYTIEGRKHGIVGDKFACEYTAEDFDQN